MKNEVMDMYNQETLRQQYEALVACKWPPKGRLGGGLGGRF